MFRPLAAVAGKVLAAFLTKPRQSAAFAVDPLQSLEAVLKPGDVLLVDGDSRVSVAIKYLTQSTWSHAALYVGPRADLPLRDGFPVSLVEADLNEGVRAIPLSAYERKNTRVCRPVGLAPADIEELVAYVVRRIGYRYDLKHVFDLARYLIGTPPVPARWRRRLIALGSGDPTRAICSTLIAQAFQSIRYPILPDVETEMLDDPECRDCYREILHVRHHSLFAPRDFDVSPYFAIVKPRIAVDFDHRSLAWGDTEERSPSVPLVPASEPGIAIIPPASPAFQREEAA